MLSRDDDQRLGAIERQLERDDPDLAHRFTQWSAGRAAARWTSAAAVAAVVFATLGVLLGLALLNPAVLLLAGAALATSWMWLYRRLRRPSRRRRDRS